MSDFIRHECGLVLIRLLQPLSYYQEKYGQFNYGLNKLYLLMEKQHNRGQDGAGIATIKLHVKPGDRYISRTRSVAQQPIKDIFERVNWHFEQLKQHQPEKLRDTAWMKDHLPYMGELLLGHLRYATYGGQTIEQCHPFLRQNNWMSRNLVVAGNFNLTNVDELFDQLIRLGQHPKEKADTVTVMEKIGHFLDLENQMLFEQYKAEGLDNQEITAKIQQKLDLGNVLRRACKHFDGGYAMAGLIGHGDAFVMRDHAGIRPAFWYADDEVVVVASERPAIQTGFNLPADKIQEIKPGHAFIIRKDGRFYEEEILQPAVHPTPCSFERIYFSRGNDESIYKERKHLGELLVPKILETIDHDFKHTVFSYIPNTAESAFFGLIKGLEQAMEDYRTKKILEWRVNNGTEVELQQLLTERPRVEKAAIKDVKLRTFITEDDARDDLVAHVYDITYGILQPEIDRLVVMDDSIVRGTTLKKSILTILGRLKPKEIIIVSSAPQIRYPDCYGINMSKMGEFVAFQAAVSLLKEQGREHILREAYEMAKADLLLPIEASMNHVKAVYDSFTDDEISERIGAIVKPEKLNVPVRVLYQTIDNLHIACAGHAGDWYFSGNYPTPGGNRVANRAFVNWMEGKDVRAY